MRTNASGLVLRGRAGRALRRIHVGAIWMVCSWLDVRGTLFSLETFGDAWSVLYIRYHLSRLRVGAAACVSCTPPRGARLLESTSCRSVPPLRCASIIEYAARRGDMCSWNFRKSPRFPAWSM